MVILSVLCDYGGHAPDDVIHQILRRLKQLHDSGQRIDKYLLQLEIFSNLRKLHPQTIQQIDDMAFTYDLIQDLRYQQGIEIGSKQTTAQHLRHSLTSKLFRKGRITYADIAELLQIDVAAVVRFHQQIDAATPA
ncbi:MAG: hypothetical protein OHK0039_27460 [Bacteroidia bacterium]